MFSSDRKKRKTDSKPDIYQTEHYEREVELEHVHKHVHKGAVADACGHDHTLDMGSLLYSLNSLSAGEETSRDMSTTNLEPERPLVASRASSVEEFERDEDKLMVDRKSSGEKLETIEDRQDVASGSAGPASASSSFFYRERSVFARSFEATQSCFSKVKGIVANPPQNN